MCSINNMTFQTIFQVKYGQIHFIWIWNSNPQLTYSDLQISSPSPPPKKKQKHELRKQLPILNNWTSNSTGLLIKLQDLRFLQSTSKIIQCYTCKAGKPQNHMVESSPKKLLKQNEWTKICKKNGKNKANASKKDFQFWECFTFRFFWVFGWLSDEYSTLWYLRMIGMNYWLTYAIDVNTCIYDK